MAWVKLDDAMPNHPKVMAAGPQGFALDVAGICYSNKHATDGFIPAYALPAVCPSLSNPAKWAARLVEVGRWVEADGGWRIHDIGDFQPSASEQKELSKKRAEAGRRGGLRSGQARAKQDASQSEPDAKQVASTESNPVPSRPVLTRAFEVFHRERIQQLEKVRRAEDPQRFAAWLTKQEDQIAESQRIWTHRDCGVCAGSGFTSTYAPGAGTVKLECPEGV